MQQWGGADQLLALLPVLHLYCASKHRFGFNLSITKACTTFNMSKPANFMVHLISLQLSVTDPMHGCHASQSNI